MMSPKIKKDLDDLLSRYENTPQFMRGLRRFFFEELDNALLAYEKKANKVNAAKDIFVAASKLSFFYSWFFSGLQAFQQSNAMQIWNQLSQNNLQAHYPFTSIDPTKKATHMILHAKELAPDERKFFPMEYINEDEALFHAQLVSFNRLKGEGIQHLFPLTKASKETTSLIINLRDLNQIHLLNLLVQKKKEDYYPMLNAALAIHLKGYLKDANNPVDLIQAYLMLKPHLKSNMNEKDYLSVLKQHANPNALAKGFMVFFESKTPLSTYLINAIAQAKYPVHTAKHILAKHTLKKAGLSDEQIKSYTHLLYAGDVQEQANILADFYTKNHNAFNAHHILIDPYVTKNIDLNDLEKLLSNLLRIEYPIDSIKYPKNDNELKKTRHITPLSSLFVSIVDTMCMAGLLPQANPALAKKNIDKLFSLNITGWGNVDTFNQAHEKGELNQDFFDSYVAKEEHIFISLDTDRIRGMSV